MKKLLHISLSLLLLMLLFNACAGDTYHIAIEDVIVVDSIDRDSVYTSNILFFGTVGNHEDVSGSRSEYPQPLPVGKYVTVYVYKEDETPEDSEVYMVKKYIIKTAGYLTPIYGTTQLEAGTYNLYAVSEYIYEYDDLPNFNTNESGVATELINGRDYLWWSQEDIEITKGGVQTVYILLQHVTARITVLCKGAPGHELSNLFQMNIGQPEPSKVAFQLGTGNITPSTTFSSSTDEAILDGMSAYTNFVPFDAENYSQLTGVVSIEFTDGTRGWYTFELPLPEGKMFKAGYNYNYTAEFTPIHYNSQATSSSVQLTSITPQ